MCSKYFYHILNNHLINYWGILIKVGTGSMTSTSQPKYHSGLKSGFLICSLPQTPRLTFSLHCASLRQEERKELPGRPAKNNRWGYSSGNWEGRVVSTAKETTPGTNTSWMKAVGCKGTVQRNKGKALFISVEKDAGKKGLSRGLWVGTVTPLQLFQGGRTEVFWPNFRLSCCLALRSEHVVFLTADLFSALCKETKHITLYW